jgi:hypothetical protein
MFIVHIKLSYFIIITYNPLVYLMINLINI